MATMFAGKMFSWLGGSKIMRRKEGGGGGVLEWDRSTL
jgi:hypothetical protein